MNIAPFFVIKFTFLNLSTAWLGLLIGLLFGLMLSVGIRRDTSGKKPIWLLGIGIWAAYIVCELYVDLSALIGGLFVADIELTVLCFTVAPFLFAAGVSFLLTQLYHTIKNKGIFDTKKQLP